MKLTNLTHVKKLCAPEKPGDDSVQMCGYGNVQISKYADEKKGSIHLKYGKHQNHLHI
jgi:hypothetical protein